MIWIVEYSVLLLESDAFQKNSWLLKLSPCFGSREGAASFIHPPKSSSQLPCPCHALPCSGFRQHWNFPLFFSGLIALALGANWIVELTVAIHVWVDFFFTFFPHLQKWTFSVRCLCSPGGCVPVPVSETPWMWDFPWQLLLLLAEGFPLIHCDQLKLTAKGSWFFLLDLVSPCWQLRNSGLQQWDF